MVTPLSRPDTSTGSMDVLALLSFMPGGRPLERTDKPLLFVAANKEHALIVASAIFDTRRDRPLVVVTPHVRSGKYDCNPRRVAANLWGTADMVLMQNQLTTSTLNTLVPEWMQTYNGSARIFSAGAEPHDPEEYHPLITPRWEGDADGERRIVATVTHLLRNPRRPVSTLERQVAQLTKQVERLTDERDQARKKVGSKKSTGDAMADAPQVWNDPQAQFDWELYNTWLEMTPDGTDRETWPLRSYILGPQFLDSMESVRTVKRRIIIRACVDVVTGRYREINSREAKHFGDRSTKVTRADGASGWRCAIVSKTPAAPRLMWWEIPPGDEVELSLVAHHDDFRIV